MRCLLIDTTTSHVTVSIIEDKTVLYKYHDIISSDMSSKIIPIIDNGFRTLDFTIKDIDKIFVSNGPGSFTGIRVGVTITKTIAWSLKKEIIPISSLELMASTNTTKKYLVPMIDARRGNVFAGIYDTNLNCIKEDSLINLNELLNSLDSNYELLSYDNLNIDKVVAPEINIEKIIGKHLNDEGINPHNLNPKYLKLTEAEENRERLENK